MCIIICGVYVHIYSVVCIRILPLKPFCKLEIKNDTNKMLIVKITWPSVGLL